MIVVNGTPQSGFAAIVADDLTAQGYNVVGTRLGTRTSQSPV